MILDTSAVVALVAREPQWRAVFDCIDNAPEVAMSSVTCLELSIVLCSPRFGMTVAQVYALLDSMRVTVVDFSSAHAAIAADASAKFGKGKHQARLNFGDCAAYATARFANDSLLFVGDDFGYTDLQAAL